jgi:hypothetical protein
MILCGLHLSLPALSVDKSRRRRRRHIFIPTFLRGYLYKKI